MRQLHVRYLLMLIVVFCAVPLFAHPSEHLNFGSQINAAQCSPAGAKLVINVNQQITGDVDSGVAGNAWAFDDLHRSIQVWQLSANTFCAVLKYQGSFTTNAGPSPNNTTTIPAGIMGTFEGGYQTTVFTATLKSAPLRSARGNIGSFNYNCDAGFICPGYVDWTTLYFDDISGFDLAWWGWVYHAGDNGSWVNAITGNSGDITP